MMLKEGVTHLLVHFLLTWQGDLYIISRSLTNSSVGMLGSAGGWDAFMIYLAVISFCYAG